VNRGIAAEQGSEGDPKLRVHGWTKLNGTSQ
jgi:hypothetical protein